MAWPHRCIRGSSLSDETRPWLRFNANDWFSRCFDWILPSADSSKKEIVRKDAGVSIAETDPSAARSTVYACVYVHVMSYYLLEEVNKFRAAFRMTISRG